MKGQVVLGHETSPVLGSWVHRLVPVRLLNVIFRVGKGRNGFSPGDDRRSPGVVEVEVCEYDIGHVPCGALMFRERGEELGFGCVEAVDILLLVVEFRPVAVVDEDCPLPVPQEERTGRQLDPAICQIKAETTVNCCNLPPRQRVFAVQFTLSLLHRVMNFFRICAGTGVKFP